MITQIVTAITTITDFLTQEKKVEVNNLVETELPRLTEEMATLIPQVNAESAVMKSYAESTASANNEATQSAAVAKASANYKGDWTSKGYTQGESVSVGDTFYACKITHTTGQDPASTAGYWKVNTVLGAVGEILSPLCDLDMNSNKFDMKSGEGEVLYTCATTQTGIDMYGDLITKAVNKPMFNENGFQSREGSTNYLPNSADFSSWTKSGNVTTGQNAPDGSTNAILSETIVINQNAIDTIVTVNTNDNTASVYVKAGTSASLSIRYLNFDTDLVARFNILTLTSNNPDAKLEDLNNDGWVRCSLPVELQGTDLVGSLYIYLATNDGTNYTSDVGNNMFAFGGQLEPKKFATPYIPTTTTAVTRATQFATLPAKYNMPSPNEGTIFIEFEMKSFANANNFIFSVRPSTNDNIVVYLDDSGDLFFIAENGGQTLVFGGETLPVDLNINSKITIRWKSNIVKIYSNGILKYTNPYLDKLFSISILDTDLRLGGISTGSTTFSGNCDIKSFKTYKKALSDTAIAQL